MHIDIAEAQELIKNNKLQEALQLYLSIDPLEMDYEEQFTIASDIGFIFYELGYYQEAIDYLLQALTIEFTDNGSVNRMLGFAYKHLNNYDLAAEYLEEAVHLLTNENEKNVCKFELARLLMLLEDFLLAEQYFKDILPFFKGKPSDYYGSSLYYLGQINIMKRAEDIADEYFNELVKLENKPHQAHAFFGKLFIANFNQDGEQMLDLAAKVMALQPDFYERETITYFTVKAYQYLNDRVTYEAALKQFIDLYPEGKYKSEYEQLKNHVFKVTEI
ncbi:MAG: tetratricopeptide repeat protein [Calditrichaeota bacterium]|nr:tetratricopeptide repeat protein [Calditrichota bacterium]